MRILACLLCTLSFLLAPPPAAALPEVLSEAVASEVEQWALSGDDKAAAGDYRGAIQDYHQALRLLPRPISQWSACGYLMVSIGDTHFRAGDFRKALTTLDLAMGCPGTQWNPFVHLRLGQVQAELGDCERAAEELVWALANAGPEIFDGEHPKYLALATALEHTPGDTC